MTRQQLIDRLAEAFAHEEGFFVTEEQARAARLTFPTRAQRNLNPGNIRRWRRNGKPYPQSSGYVDFAALFPGDREAALAEGWRVLKVLIGKYVDGGYHGGSKPTLLQLLAVYSPSADGNDPERYARHVAQRAGVPTDVPLTSLITA